MSDKTTEIPLVYDKWFGGFARDSCFHFCAKREILARFRRALTPELTAALRHAADAALGDESGIGSAIFRTPDGERFKIRCATADGLAKLERSTAILFLFDEPDPEDNPVAEVSLALPDPTTVAKHCVEVSDDDDGKEPTP